MQIYFVRHGKTEWNLASRFQGGHGDSPLLPQSKKDIQKLGKYLRGTKFRGIFASPLDRAFNTAQGIDDAMNANLPVTIDERLREFNLGDMEGMKFADAEKKYPKQMDNFWHHPDQYDPTELHGEDYPHVIARGKSFAEEMAKLEKKIQARARLRVRQYRLENKKSQQDVADYLGIDISTYNKYEKGSRKLNNEVIRKIAEYYNIKVSDILD